MAELGIVLRSYLPVQLSVELAQEAERRGFHSVWVTESMDAKDAYTQMAAIAMSTDRIHVGSGITPIYTRTPVIAVMSMLALAELSKERAILGLGTGHPIGVATASSWRPLTAMREYVEIVRLPVREREFRYEGRYTTSRVTRAPPVRILRTIPSASPSSSPHCGRAWPGWLGRWPTGY